MQKANEKFIFIRVPKTASSSVNHVLEKHCSNYKHIKGGSTPQYNEPIEKLKHTIFQEFSEDNSVSFGHINIRHLLEIGWISKSYYDCCFKFAFVRNPWDRLVSLYMHRINFIKEKLPNFSIWLRDLLASDIPPVGLYNVRGLSQANSQLDWIPEDINFIGRYENLQKDFSIICDYIKLSSNIPLPNILKTNHLPYWTYYDEESRKLVAYKYQEEIERFNYKFKERKYVFL